MEPYGGPSWEMEEGRTEGIRAAGGELQKHCVEHMKLVTLQSKDYLSE